jgi:spore coat polysaccharide biosynthesis protein SpsF (cytidylyltransferase family)
MSLAIIIQARAGSKRLPNKMLLPFYDGKSLIEMIVDKLKQLNILIIVATTTNQLDDEIHEVAKKLNVNCYRGSEEDVLNRFINAAKKYNVDKIIRVCADNPFLDVEELKLLIDFSLSKNYDYVSFNVNGQPSIKTHYGFWAEFVTLGTLIEIENSTKDFFYHEHVTNYIYSNPEKFNICWIDRSLHATEIRLTVDTEADFNTAKEIFNILSNDNNFITYTDLINFLNQNIKYLNSMKQEIINNTK